MAVGVLGVMTWIETRSQVSDATTGRDAAAVLRDAYQAAGSWQQADLRSAILLAATTSGASLSALDSSGQIVHGGIDSSGLGRGAGGGFWARLDNARTNGSADPENREDLAA